MQRLNVDNEAAAALIERRWFATITAVRELQAECEVLREVMEMAENAWRRARSQLARLETLRDALGEELAERDALYEQLTRASDDRAISSAA